MVDALRRVAARRRMWLRVAQVLGVLAIVVALALGGLVYRLSQAPLSVGFLTPSIVEAVQKQLPGGFGASIADTVIERDAETGEVLLRLRDVAIVDADGEPVFAAPRAAIGLSGVALLTGRVIPRSVSLIRPSIELVEENGRLRMRTGSSAPTADVASGRMAGPIRAAAVLFALLGQSGTDPDGGLISIGARRASIAVTRADGSSGRIADIDISAVRAAAPGLVGFTASLGADPGAPQLEGFLQRLSDGAFSLTGKFGNITTGDFEGLIGGGLPFILTGPLSGSVSGTIDSSGMLSRLSAEIRLGAGYVGTAQARILVDEADLAFDWNYASGVIEIRPSHLLAGESRGTVTGQIAVPSRGDFSYGTVPLKLEFSDVTLDDPATNTPAAYDSAILEAFFVPAQRVLHISRLDIVGADTAGSFVGFIGGAGESPGVKLAGSVAPTSVVGLKSVWPPFLADKARRWFVNNAEAGQIRSGRVTIDMAPGEIAAAIRKVPLHRKAFEIEFNVEDGVFRFLRQMPPLAGIDAVGKVDALEFEIVTTGPGRIDLPDGGVIDVPEARFFVPDVPATPSSGVFEADLAGNIKEVLRLLDYPPVELAKRRNFDIDGFDGDGRFDFTIGLPLVEGLRFTDIDLTVEGGIDGFAAASFAGARNIKEGDIDVSVAGGRVTISGEALVDGVRADLTMEDSIDESGEPGARSVTMTLDEAARERLGMPLDAILSGPIVITVSDVRATEAGTTQSIEADLTQASIAFPALGISKPAGESAKATFNLTQSGQAIKLGNLRLQADSLRAEGEAEFVKGGDLTRLNLPVLRTPRGTDVSISGGARSGERVFKVAGASLDLRALLGGLGEAAGETAGSGTARINVELDVARAIGVGGEELANLQGVVRRAGERTERLDISAATSNGVPVSVRYSDDGANADLAVDSEDAGRVLAWAGYYPNMRGGQLRLVASRRGAGTPLAGQIAIDRFRIANDPSLTRLIQGGEQETATRPAAPAPTNPAPVQQINTADVGFDRLNASFERGDGDMRVKDGVLRGVAVGATFEGSIDFVSEKMNLHGTYVPLYALNNLFGQLPLFLGPLLGGKKDEGLLGITYSLSGSTKAPVLTINPMSVVAPGVFRYILGMDNPQAPVRGGAAAGADRINR